MAETTETPTTTTEGAVSSEAAAATLLSSTEPAATTEQPSTPATEVVVKPGEGGTKPAETKPEGAPETYEFKAPDGKEYDSAVLDSFSTAAKAANLTQDAAQKLLESMAPSLAARQLEQVATVQAGWAEASKTDTEFGGEKLQENLAVAKKALTTYATPEFRKLLDDTGLGNHPEVIRMLFKVGKGLSEDGFVAGRPGGIGTSSVTSLLYDNTPSKKE